jgi:hypothetical protein
MERKYSAVFLGIAGQKLVPLGGASSNERRAQYAARVHVTRVFYPESLYLRRSIVTTVSRFTRLPAIALKNIYL